MEFLMAYGWAIISVLLTIAALAYFGVLNQSLFVPESCILFPGVACIETLVSDLDATLIVRNGAGETFSTFDVTIDGCGTGSAAGGLAADETETIVIPSCTFSGSKSIKKSITIEYTSENVFHVRTGKISAIVVPDIIVAAIDNGGFEIDDGTNYGFGDATAGNNLADGWIYQGQADLRTAAQAHSGSYSTGYLSISASDTYPNTLRQIAIDVTPGNYQIQWWDKSTISTGGRMQGRVINYDTSAILATTSGTITPTSSWTQRTLAFTVPSGTTRISFYLWISSTLGCGGCSDYIDDVTIQVV